MSSTLYYFLQVILCSGIMVGYYWLVLRNNRFHQYNRFYLLGIALFAWIVPLIKIQWNKPVETDPQLLQFFSVIADNNTEIESNLHVGWYQLGWQGLLMMIYALVALVLLYGLIKSIVRIYQLLKTHSCKSVGEVFLILTQAKGAPFSFFRYIFWHESIDLKSEAGKQMMQHELTHVQQKHSIDKIIIQLILIAGWFNPFFWLIKKEMEMIHEFIADKKAVSNGDSATLAQMLLAAAYPQQQYLLTNPFFFSPIKRRLQMITNNTNPKFSYMRRLIVLPLLAIVVVLFAFRTKELRNAENISVGTLVDKIAEQNYFTSKEQTIIKDTTILHSDSVYIIPKGKNVQFISEGIDSSKAIRFTGIAMQDKMNFYAKDGSVAFNGDRKKLNFNSNGKDTGLIRFNATIIDSIPPLYVIDGVKANPNAMREINPNSIHSITVLKNASAVESFGEEGRHGVIMITSKNDFIESNRRLVKNQSSKSLPTYDVDLSNIKPEQSTSSFKVVEGRKLNSNDAAERQSINGVVEGYKLNAGELNEKPVKVVQGFKINPNPLAVINGMPFYADFNEIKINPKDIESVNILKKEAAIKKYGEAAEFGAIEIKTKKALAVNINNNSDPSGTKAFLKKNPAIKRVSWNHDPLRMNLEFKDGSIETYDLSNSSSVEKAMNKYGKLSLPAPPPPPLVRPTQVKEERYDKVFTKTEVPAAFPGGYEAMQKYLKENLGNPFKEGGAPPGKYTVNVSFDLDMNGNIKNVKATNDPGYGSAKAVEKIFLDSPKWTPAKQNGKNVASKQGHGFTFIVD